ncbi:trans-aconitate 2-methyltransferase [Azoarcus olearius]|uniref:Trans-aconitate 2-methyltransferase n=1 Tax=Azoarcus sp. (strain BH72) TaxID=418699 RepID=TAM_AZOSB|nr:trans-aconitate 2-methyltransferase [Azoarcus olearius]A1K8U5.1 RecName: Full=Trans-aconitate 2-methyltransferase [Azoarcus olearius]CAL95250.1 probable trans-aconitate 2-methyltransferase [Azoarcus olearius]
MPTWDDQQYLKFADERTRAARDLLARVPLDDAATVVDLGCGPGNSTALLVERWPQARVVGVDSSAEMLRSARQALPQVEWMQADLRAWAPAAPVDLIFANAVMQWLPDHATLLPELLRHLRPGGVLAIQMPRNYDEPSHRLMRETPGPWAARLAGARAIAPLPAAAWYYDLLAPHARQLELWQTTYEQVMDDAGAIVEWVRGTGLRPYLEALAEDEHPAYLAAYEAGIDAAYPPRSDGRRLFPFPRLFMVAVR